MTTYCITGANRGIGLEFARQLTANGHAVIGTARDPDAATALAETGARVERLDTSDESSVQAFADRLSGEPVDVLVNNAAVFLDQAKMSFLETTPQDLMNTYRVNNAGVLIVTQALLPNVKQSARKLVVHISSDYGSIDVATRSSGRGHLAYRSSKAALNMMHVLSANELADHGVTAIAIHPGWVQTDMGGQNAAITPEHSVTTMRALIDRAAASDNAKFFSHEGHELTW